MRNVKGLQTKSRTMQVIQVGANWYRVTNPQNGKTYDVNLGVNGGTCTCEYGQHRPATDTRSGCSHVIAAIEHKTGRRVKVFDNLQAARKDKHTMLKIGDSLILSLR